MDETVFISGPDPQLKLTYSDVWLPGLYSRRLLCFELPADSSHARAVDVVKRGLKALVQGLPELGGVCEVVGPEKEGDIPWRAIKPYKGIELVVRDMSSSFMSFQSFARAGYPLEALKDQALLPIPLGINPEPQAICKVQLSLINGGVLLGFCAYHHLTDGNGMNSIMIALGEECRRAAETTDELKPRVFDTDRSIIQSLTGSKKDISQHPAYCIVPGCMLPPPYSKHEEHDDSVAGIEDKAEQLIRYYHISDENARALKAAASARGPVSTHDAISALIWRTVICARYKLGKMKPDLVSIYSIPHNGRKHLGLDKDWIGNCTYFFQAEQSVANILKDDSLPVLASAIRASLNEVDGDTVASVFEIRKAQPWDLTWGPFLVIDNPEIVGFTSFYHSGLYTDYGPALGKVQHFTTTNEGAFSGFYRSFFVGPKLPGGYACDVALGLDIEENKCIENDELWLKYFK